MGFLTNIIFFCFCLLVSCTRNSSLHELKEIEINYLEVFFQYLFETTNVGYVLYGEKPISFCQIKSIEDTIPGTMEHKDSVILTQGLNAWKKLGITGKNYLFFSQASNEDPVFQEIVFVNKKAFQKAVRENLSLFRLKLGPQMNEQNLLENILTFNGFFHWLKGHESLQGILLGYGVENSLTYERGEALYKAVFKASGPNPPFQIIHEPETVGEVKQKMIDYAKTYRNNGESLVEELADFSFYTPEEGEKVIPKIGFTLHTESKESKNLIEEYKEVEKKVAAIQKEKKILEKVLKKFRE